MTSSTVGYEVDVLAVGDGSKGGDAIALRFGDLQGPRDRQTVMIVDGGTKVSGEALVAHVRDFYGTSHVDLVVNSHPDNDHVSGLTTVLECLSVGQLAMHRPWAHAGQVRWTFADGRLTDRSLSEKLRRSIEAAHELEVLARRRGVPLVEPFTGAALRRPWGEVLVLGPRQEYYERLLCDFCDTPEARLAAILPSLARDTRRGGTNWILETIDRASETLRDDATTSAENNSSVILLVTAGEHEILLTADAGIAALSVAINDAQLMGIDFARRPLSLLQVPHHGSRRNVGPGVLDQLPAANAVISAPPASEKHPAAAVVNALIRRGVRVHATQGRSLRYSRFAPARPGWEAPAPALGFSMLVALPER